MNLREKLTSIQVNLKAPKNLYNSFGKYNYRNAEGICEAVKPYLKAVNVSLLLSDEIVGVGDRIYVKAIATLRDNESDEIIQVTAYARESAEKKGQDDSQITGTASSYARKYALNGLFLLDDTKDADTDEYHNQTKGKSQKSDEKEEKAFNEQAQKELAENATEAQKKAVQAICAKHKLNAEDLCAMNGFSFANMTKGQASNMIMSLKKKFGDD